MPVIVTKKFDNYKRDTFSQYILRNLQQFLWTDIPGIVSAALWKAYGTCDVQNHTLEKKDCCAVVSVCRDESDALLIQKLADSGLTVVVGRGSLNFSNEFNYLVKDSNGKIVFLDLDLKSLNSIRDFVKIIDERYSDVALLINNCSKLFHGYRLTEDGFETNMAINYYSQFFLTHLLMKNLTRTAKSRNFYSRVINVTSHEFYGKRIDFEDMNHANVYRAKDVYAQTKLAMLMMVKYLEENAIKNNFPLHFYAVNTGMLEPRCQTSLIMKTPLLSWMLPWLQIEPSERALALLYACCSKDLDMCGGCYLNNSIKYITTIYAADRREYQKLFDKTCELLKIKIFGLL